MDAVQKDLLVRVATDLGELGRAKQAVSLLVVVYSISDVAHPTGVKRGSFVYSWSKKCRGNRYLGRDSMVLNLQSGLLCNLGRRRVRCWKLFLRLTCFGDSGPIDDVGV